MMTKPRYMKPFSEQELKALGTKPGFFPGMAASYSFNTPISYRENVMNTFMDKRPCFAVSNRDFTHMNCDYFQAHLGRGGRANPNFTDAFGVKWTFEPTAGGSISVGGNPRFVDVNDWKDAIKMPDVNNWDWAADAEKNKVNTDFAVLMTPTNGFWFERLISFMTFEGAAMALLDDDQIDAVKELIHETTNLYMYIVDKCEKYFPKVAGYCIHDDWGSQMAPFFSEEIGREVFLPEMKRFVDHVHSKGKYIELHSCGKLEKRACVFADAGFDLWSPMDINDTELMFNEQGDRIIIAQTCRELADPDNATEEELREAARSFAKKFAHPDKVATLSAFGAHPAYGSLAFREELYKASRIACCGQE